MGRHQFKIPRTADTNIANAFKELGTKFNIIHADIETLAESKINKIELQSEPADAWKTLLDYDSYLISTLSCSVDRRTTISYQRGGLNHDSPIFDEIIFNYNESGGGNIEIVHFLMNRLHSFQSDRVIGNGISEEQSQLIAIHNSTLERLEKLNEDLIRQSTDFRNVLEEKFEEKAAQIKAEYVEKERRLKIEEEALAAQITAKEKALEEKLKIIDDRDNTHVRREIRDRMLDDVKQRISQFGVSKTTANKRRPVLIGILSLLTAFVGLLAWTGYEINAMDGHHFSMLEAIRNISAWEPEKLKTFGVSADTIAKLSATDVDRTHLFWLWGRFTLYSFGLLGTILYYIKWQNKWAEQHIVSEFQLQQFYIDVNRANWVIESCLEWRKETETAIPTELLGSITTGLFINNQTEPERVIHPADELASALLGTASKLKLKVGDSELDFDKPKKIQNNPIKIGSSSSEA